MEITVVVGGGRKNPVIINANKNINGSRFAALMEDNEENMLGNNNNEGNSISNGPIMELLVVSERENGKGKKGKIMTQ
jgi:hypothetical protein